MNDEQIKDLLEKAKQSLLASQKLFENGFSDFCVSRSYYTMFYVVEAILLSQDLSFSKHSGVISAFGKNFIKPGIIDKKFHQTENLQTNLGFNLTLDFCEKHPKLNLHLQSLYLP